LQRKINTTNVETLAEFPKLRLSFNRFEEMISSGNFRILEKRTQSDLRPEKACKPPQEIASQECSFSRKALVLIYYSIFNHEYNYNFRLSRTFQCYLSIQFDSFIIVVGPVWLKCFSIKISHGFKFAEIKTSSRLNL